MKKVFSILALALLTTGFYSCETETDVQDTEAMFEQLTLDQNATDTETAEKDGRGDD
jgi:PBP1b-binding outer membrane lipoprotein LpoB